MADEVADKDKTAQRTLRLTDATWDDWLVVAGRIGQAHRVDAIRLLGRAAARCPIDALRALMAGLACDDRPMDA